MSVITELSPLRKTCYETCVGGTQYCLIVMELAYILLQAPSFTKDWEKYSVQQVQFKTVIVDIFLAGPVFKQYQI